MEWRAVWRRTPPETAGRGRAAADALLYATPDRQPPIFSAAIHCGSD
ncbi:hypothetical protein L810_1064 [Burkholderia sp. AU4i]|nr:hypothetical protein L810_1064 [Burkholderia sp. AU4i]